MPRARFATSALQGAVPGISQAIAAAFGGQRTQEDAADKTMLNQSRIAQAIASAQSQQSEAGLRDAKAAQERQTFELAQPGAVRERAMLASGVPLDAAPDVQQYLQSGRIDKFDAGGQAGPTMPAPEWAGKSNLGAVAKRIAASQGVLSGDSANQADYFKGQGQQFQTGVAQAILDGTLKPSLGGAAAAASEGKPLFQRDATGSVLDLFGGALDTANPLATATIGLRTQQGEQARTGAVENLAQAGAADATAGLRGAQMGAVGKTGAKAPSGYQWTTNPDTGEPAMEPTPGGPKDASKAPAKPLPTSALKMQQEELDAIGTSGSINADLAAVEQQIATGKLKLGLVTNALGSAKNYVGLSDENSKNLASFRAKLENLRNSSLQLNKGVQTDGDAQRAWNELIANINDQGVVTQRLAEIRALNERAANLRRMNVDILRNNYGLPPLDTDPRFQQPAAIGAGLQRPAPAGRLANPTTPPGPAASAPDRRVSPSDQKRRDSDRVPILQSEWLKAAPGSPDRASLERELRRLKASPPEDRRAPGVPAAAATPAGFRYLGTEN